MYTYQSDRTAWSTSFSRQLRLTVRPAYRNCYSCYLTSGEATALSNALLECAAKVERKSGGQYDGLLWLPSYKSVFAIADRAAVTIQSYATTVGLTIFRTRHYSVDVELAEALELACQLWVQSRPTVSAA